MSKQSLLMILANVMFVLFYVYVDWAQYTLFNVFGLSPVIIQSHFPSYIQITVTPPTLSHTLIVVDNFPLLIFITTIIFNLYFIIKLQKSKK